MSKRLFGTDGVRGVANDVLTPQLCFEIGQAAGHYLLTEDAPPRVAMGRDTRRSGAMLGAALASGFCSVGVDVTTLGVVPTGCVSFIARTGDYGMGAVISASHNPAPDNGVKLIAHDGRKLADEHERRVESLIAQPPSTRCVGADIGALEPCRDEIERYLDYLESIVPERLEGMHVTVDGSHGAAYELGPAILKRLGAKVTVTGVSPDGMNINAEGGATKPQTIQDLTRGAHATIGIAFDGDADRAVFSDSLARLINGDRTMAMWCGHWRSTLTPPIVVGTVMSNGGFESYLQQNGISLERVTVGDKYVSQRLVEIGGRIGGEQSGHIIFPERGPTGDGLITALEILRVLAREDRPASDFLADYDSWPQVLVNLSVSSKEAYLASEPIQEAIDQANDLLGIRGRISVRPSGTQPMVRVMVEADEYALRDDVTSGVVEAFEKHVEGRVYSRVDLTNALGD